MGDMREQFDALRAAKRERKGDPAIIRAGVAERAKARGLNDDQRIQCENAALTPYWYQARSRAFCISVGVAEVEATVKRRDAGIVPDPMFCRHRDRCAGLSRCPLDHVCND